MKNYILPIVLAFVLGGSCFSYAETDKKPADGADPKAKTVLCTTPAIEHFVSKDGKVHDHLPAVTFSRSKLEKSNAKKTGPNTYVTDGGRVYTCRK